MSNEHTHYAYGEEHADIETVMRLHAVKRWHMIDTTRIQTLAEHTANVALLAYAIAKTTPGMFFGGAAFPATIGLLHDLDEVFTGDIPSHTKHHLTGIDELSQKTLPAVFIESYGQDIKLLVKICDLADSIRFIRLHGVDATARHAREGLEVQWKHKQDAASDAWAGPVCAHVFSKAAFYAYEFS